MKHIIVGTAGHIDHGKTTLIKYLTGRDTDNLREEKERGISIDLGFTYFDLPSGKRVGIIDVPGHEKFVKNMLAGASGIDLVLMVIAADEGIMPQTEEHLNILNLLSIKKGIIVLTKKDMVEEELLEFRVNEVREVFKDSFLKDAPICPVSSKTGEGMEELIKVVENLIEETQSKDIEIPFRCSVDRVFSISGFGTVITGTVISGRIEEGEMVEIYPSNIKTRIRGIRVHDEKVKFAEAGERAAINLQGVKVEEVSRGDVISEIGTMENSFVVDCKLYYLKEEEKSLKNRQRIRIHHGAKELLGRVHLLFKEELLPGEEGYVQLRLENPLPCKRGDRFIVRSYSPMHTIGGGVILEPLARKEKNMKEEYIKDLMLKETGDTKALIEKTILKYSSQYPTINFIKKYINIKEEILKKEFKVLEEENKILELNKGGESVYLHKNYIEQIIDSIKLILKDYHKKNPLKFGVKKEEIKGKILNNDTKQKIYDSILEVIKDMGVIDIRENYISLKEFTISYNENERKIKEYILEELNKNPFSPPSYEELSKSEKNLRDFKGVFNSLVENGEISKVTDNIFFSREAIDRGKEMIKAHIEENGNITLGQIRDLFGTTRKYAFPLAEYYDYIKFTKRLGEGRILY